MIRLCYLFVIVLEAFGSSENSGSLFLWPQIQRFPIPVHRVYPNVHPENCAIHCAAADFCENRRFDEGTLSAQRSVSQITKALKAAF